MKIGIVRRAKLGKFCGVSFVFLRWECRELES